MKPGSAKVGDKISYISYDKEKFTCIITRIEETEEEGRRLWGYWTGSNGIPNRSDSWMEESKVTLERISWKDRICHS